MRKSIDNKLSRIPLLLHTYNQFVYSMGMLRKKKIMTSNKFVIFAQGRTGSTLLASLLNSHPEVFCDGEILDHKKFFPMDFIRGRCAISNARVYGFKLKIYHIREDQKISDTKQFVLGLCNCGWKIIYLKRLNIFRHALSDVFLDYRHATGKGAHHMKSNGSLNLKRLYVDCDKLLHFMMVREAIMEEEKELLTNIPHISVTYEDTLLREKDRQYYLNQIFDYLNIEHAPVSTKYVRTSSDKLPDFVLNHDEVIRTVSKTKYAKYVTDPYYNLL